VLASWHFTCFKRSVRSRIPSRKYKSINGCKLSAQDGQWPDEVWPLICIYSEATNPMHIQAGIHAVDDNNPDFRSFRDGEGERSFEHIVRFEQPFATVPKILVALSHLDIASYAALRLNITAEKISASGFTLRYFTWGNTQILGLGAQWMAFHESPISQ